MSVFRFARRLACAALVAIWVAAAVACGSSTRTSRPRAANVDDFGDTVGARASGSEPRRIVSLNPTTTEILFAIGAGSRLVGRTHWDVFPHSAIAVPDLGNGLRPNIEAVLSAHPDLVVLYASNDNQDAARALHAAGITTLSLKIDRIADFRRGVRLLGLVTGDSARAQTVVDSVDRTLQRVGAATRGLRPASVFWQSLATPLLTIGDSIFLNELLEIAGGRSIFRGLASPTPQVSLEEVIRRNPDYVIVLPANREQLLADPAWRSVPAVHARHVLVADTLVLGRPSVRMGEGALSLARLLHPGSI